MTRDLFGEEEKPRPCRETMADGAVLLRGWALPMETEILAALDKVAAAAPFRRMVTPGGFVMSVAMTNCGTAGWVTDRTGYRYDRRRSSERKTLARHAREFPDAGDRRRRGGGLSRVHA